MPSITNGLEREYYAFFELGGTRSRSATPKLHL